MNGFEKKNSNKITLGDFSATEYAFSAQGKRKNVDKYNKYKNKYKWNDGIKMNRDEFISYFGNYNSSKKRYSWSGSCTQTGNVYPLRRKRHNYQSFIFS